MDPESDNIDPVATRINRTSDDFKDPVLVLMLDKVFSQEIRTGVSRKEYITEHPG